jgi:hypothetical protein
MGLLALALKIVLVVLGSAAALGVGFFLYRRSQRQDAGA